VERSERGTRAVGGGGACTPSESAVAVLASSPCEGYRARRPEDPSEAGMPLPLPPPKVQSDRSAARNFSSPRPGAPAYFR